MSHFLATHFFLFKAFVISVELVLSLFFFFFFSFLFFFIFNVLFHGLQTDEKVLGNVEACFPGCLLLSSLHNSVTSFLSNEPMLMSFPKKEQSELVVIVGNVVNSRPNLLTGDLSAQLHWSCFMFFPFCSPNSKTKSWITKHGFGGKSLLRRRFSQPTKLLTRYEEPKR